MRPLLATVLALTLVISVPVWGFDWSHAATTIAKSTVVIQHKVHGLNKYQTVCTGFVTGFEEITTADHCYGSDMRVDGMAAIEVGHDLEFDLMILKVPGLRKVPVLFNPIPVEVGKEIAAYGHAYGGSDMTLKTGNVGKHDRHNYEVTFDSTYIGGMSGAPVIDTGGMVVGIVQSSNSNLGLGADSEAILWFIGMVRYNNVHQ